jgi:hypothetical protein
MTGATMTEVGTPASPSCCRAASRARARLHGAGELGVERGDRHRHFDEAALGHGGEQIEVAQDQCRLGDDAHRVARRGEQLQDAAHDAVALLDGLIRIGIGADGYGLDLVAGISQLALERLRGVGLGEQLGLEIESRRQSEKGMGGPREAVDAAMLAAAIGVDRAVEADIR